MSNQTIFNFNFDRIKDFLDGFCNTYISSEITDISNPEIDKHIYIFLQEELFFSKESSNGESIKSLRTSDASPQEVTNNMLIFKINQIWQKIFPFLHWSENDQFPCFIPNQPRISLILSIVYLIHHSQISLLAKSENPDDVKESFMAINQFEYHELIRRMTQNLFFDANGVFPLAFEGLQKNCQMLVHEKTELSKKIKTIFADKTQLLKKIDIYEEENLQNEQRINDLTKEIVHSLEAKSMISKKEEQKYLQLLSDFADMEQKNKLLETKNSFLLKENRELMKSVTYYKTQIDRLIPFEENVKSMESLLKCCIDQREIFGEQHSFLTTRIGDLLFEVERLEKEKMDEKNENRRLLLENSIKSNNADFLSLTLQNVYDFLIHSGFEVESKEIVDSLKFILEKYHSNKEDFVNHSQAEKHQVKNFKKVISQLHSEIERLVWKVREDCLPERDA